MPRVRPRFGKPQGVKLVGAEVEKLVADAVAKAAINRTRKRLSGHPSGIEAGAGMTVENVQSFSATIVSQRGNPGIIPAQRFGGLSRWGKRALYWPGARNPVKFVKNYKGLAPLIEAEALRVSSGEVEINARIK